MIDVKRLFCGVVWATVGFCATTLLAQQQDAETPKPAAREYAPLVDTADVAGTEQNRDAIQPDSLPVSGMQNVTLGMPPLRHSYIVPGIQYGNTLSSGSAGTTGTGTKTVWSNTSFVSGNASLFQEWGYSTLSMNYSGGGYFSTDKAEGSGHYQQLAATYEIDQKRWKALFIDQFALLPESSFGFGGTTGLSTPGIGGSLSVPQAGLQSNFLPNQSIFTGTGSRYSNSAAVQFSYQVSTRGAVSVGGAYGILRFANSGGASSDSDILNIGYDYLLSTRNSIGVSYGFSAYHFPGSPQAIGDQITHVIFGRKVTGRIALRLGGGPEITTFRVTTGGLGQRISGSGTASLTYALAHSTIGLDYMHAVSGGGGVFNGANTDQVTVSFSKQLTRVWNGHVNVGYAKNRQLAGTTPSTNFDSWVTGAGLSRPLTRATNFSIGYQSQIQSASGTGCNFNCGQTYISHQIIMSIQWHMLPFVLR
jgi:hypothetical protein